MKTKWVFLFSSSFVVTGRYSSRSRASVLATTRAENSLWDFHLASSLRFPHSFLWNARKPPAVGASGMASSLTSFPQKPKRQLQITIVAVYSSSLMGSCRKKAIPNLALVNSSFSAIVSKPKKEFPNTKAWHGLTTIWRRWIDLQSAISDLCKVLTQVSRRGIRTTNMSG